MSTIEIAEPREFSMPLSGGKIAVVKVWYPMSDIDFDQLMETLELWRPALTIPQS